MMVLLSKPCSVSRISYSVVTVIYAFLAMPIGVTGSKRQGVGSGGTTFHLAPCTTPTRSG